MSPRGRECLPPKEMSPPEGNVSSRKEMSPPGRKCLLPEGNVSSRRESLLPEGNVSSRKEMSPPGRECLLPEGISPPGRECLLPEGNVSSRRECLVPEGNVSSRRESLSSRRNVSSRRECLLAEGMSPRGGNVSSRRKCLLPEGMRALASSAAQARIQDITQCVAKHVEAEHGGADGQPWPDRQPWRLQHERAACPAEHRAPGRKRRRHAITQERQRRFRQNSHAKLRRRQHQDRRGHIRQHIPLHDAPVPRPDTARRLHVRLVAHPQHCAAHDA